MDLGSLFVILAILVMVAAFVSRPFVMKDIVPAVDHSPEEDDARERKLSALLAEHERLLTALQELDFDNALGKIPADEYPSQRSQLLQSAANVLRQLDSFSEAQPQQGVEARLEAAIAAHRADAAQSSPELVAIPAAANGKDEIEALIAQRRAARKEKSAGFCPRCGKPVTKSDIFCSKCGAKLA